MSDEPLPRAERVQQAGTLLQVGATVAALALALATIIGAEGSKFSLQHVFILALLFSGFCAVLSCLCTVYELRVILGKRSAPLQLLSAALLILFVAYIAILADSIAPYT